MSTHHRTLVSCVAAAALLVSCATASSMWRTAEQASAPSIVQFSDEAVNPQTVSIAPEGNVRWSNMAADAVGFVVFPGNIVSSFQCQDLRPYLTKLEDGRYRSPPITGLVSERAQLPCALASGSYDYEVWLMGEGFGIEANDTAVPQQILRAKIVVE